MKKLLLSTVCAGLFLFGSHVNSAVIIPPLDPETRLGVTYTNGSVLSGPLSFGLTALPTEVNASFLLGAGTPILGSSLTGYDLGDVFSAEVSFGNATWTSLANFSMVANSAGNVNSLTYEFAPFTTNVIDGGGYPQLPINHYRHRYSQQPSI